MARLKDYLLEKAEEWAMSFPSEELYIRIDEYLETILTTGRAPMKQPSKLTLTTQQAQYLKVVLAHTITELTKEIDASKKYVSYLYDQCDKDKPEETQSAFRVMNRQKDAVKYFKNEVQKLAEIQRVIKQLAK